jgi:5-methylcytosine-specific restriction endonuclease McrA
MVKKRDGLQCQICGDRVGDPHCILHAHHIRPRAQGGHDVPENVITLCDLCHAVVTRRWHKPWFGSAAITDRPALEEARQEYMDFLTFDPVLRRERQTRLWEIIGVWRESAGRNAQ